jgi:hypothetical protein
MKDGAILKRGYHHDNPFLPTPGILAHTADSLADYPFIKHRFPDTGPIRSSLIALHYSKCQKADNYSATTRAAFDLSQVRAL